MKELQVVVTVSPDQSDLYFANQLIERLNVVGVIIENQTEPRDNTPNYLKAKKLFNHPVLLLKKIYDFLVGRHIRKYAVYNKQKYQADFGPQGKNLVAKGNYQTLYTNGVNDINAVEQITWLKNIKPDIIAVCGASIFKEEIISIPTHGVLNLHGGLAQRYRGLFTTDWAVHNEEPEYVGATVHYISPGIDTGDIFYQSRPNIEPSDNPNSLYVKVVKMGINMMEKAISDIQSGIEKPSPLNNKGTLYLGRMFTQAVKSNTWKKVKKGIIVDYLNNKEERDRVVLTQIINAFEKN